MYLLLIILLIIYLITLCERFIDYDIIILNKNELYEILKNNKDNYYDTFKKDDFKVRNIKTIDEYIELIKSSPYTIDIYEKIILINTISIIRQKIKTFKIIGFDGEKASNIKIVIGVINDNNYEGGYPHTRGDVIIIHRNILYNGLHNILLHELVHLYQKIYPEDIELYLLDNEFIETNEIFDGRANPDITQKLYKNKNNETLKCVYKTNPIHLMDVIYKPINESKYEHPLEYMAYNIESKII